MWTIDTVTKLGQHGRYGPGRDETRLLVEQATSGLAALVMVAFVIYWLRLFPLRRDAWVAAITGHAVGTVLFAFGHYSLIVVFRAITYSSLGMGYIWREPFVAIL